MITCQDLLKRAELLSNENSEIEWRDSVKHSYYFVYHHLKLFLDQNSINLIHRDMGEHQFIIERLKSISNPLAHKLARDIQTLKDKRVLACYYLDNHLTKLQAKQQLRECQRVIANLSKLSTELKSENEPD